MTDITQAASAAEFESMGVDSATAAWAAAAHEAHKAAQVGRGDGTVPALPNASSPQAGGSASEAQARLGQLTADRADGKIADYQWRELAKPGGELDQLTNRITGGPTSDLAHLEQLYQPPAHAWDYKIPPATGTVTDEARAADSALVSLLHTERVPLDLGNALMADIATGRQVKHSAETISTLRPWADQLLGAARASPALRGLVEGASADQFLAVISRETAAALVPFARYRAARR